MKRVFVLLLSVGVTSGAFALNTVTQNQYKTTAQRTISGVTSTNWFTAANWGGAVGVPQNDSATQCNGVTLYGSSATSYNSSGAVDSVIIAGSDAATGELRVGSSSTASTGNPAALTINSGTLTIGNQYSTTAYVSGGSGFMSVGSDSASGTGRNGLFYMNGGTLTATSGQGAITIGNGNAVGANCFGKMWMTDGAINCTSFNIAKNAGVEGDVYLSGGTITANTLSFGAGTGLLQLSGTGQFQVLTASGKAALDTYLATPGLITAVGGTLQESTNGAYTVLSVVPEPATVCLLGLGAMSLIRRKK